MAANKTTISEGHVASRLLYEFAETPARLERHTAEFIEGHIGACEQCHSEFEQIRQVLASKTGAEQPSAGVWQRFAAWISGNRLVLAGAMAVIVVVSIFLFRPTLDYQVSALSPSDGRAAGEITLDLPLGELTRGDTELPPALSLEGIESGIVVLRIVIDVFEDEEPPGTIIVTNNAGETVWRGDIGTLLAENDVFLLLIDKSTFEKGRYAIEVLDRNNTVVVRGRLDL
jgi:hypothetical protein